MKTTLPATTLAAGDNPQPAGTRLGCVLLSLACFCFLFGDPVLAQKPAPQKAADGTLTIDPAQMKPWTGNLGGMIERRVIRVLTVNSKTFYDSAIFTAPERCLDFIVVARE